MNIKIKNKFNKINIETSSKVVKSFKKFNCLNSKLFFDEIKKLNSRKCEIITIKPETNFFKLSNRTNDDKNLFHLNNVTKKRNEEEISFVFMRTIYKILNQTINNLSKLETSDNDTKNYNIALAQNLINQLFYFSSKSSGILRLNLTKIDTEKFFNQIINKLTILKVINRSQIKVNVSKDTPNLYIDYEKIESVITTLICNAIRYSTNETPIELNTSYKDNKIIIEVKDYGKGIPKKHINDIFDKFYHISRMIPGSKRADNLSIGLHHAKYIIESHNGEIYAESELNKGTSFFIVFDCELIKSKNYTSEFNPDMMKIDLKNKFLKIRFPAQNKYLSYAIEKVEFFLEKFNFDFEDLNSINLSIAESLGNAVMHGSNSEKSFVEISLTIKNDGILIKIKDDGGKFFFPTFFEKIARSKQDEIGGRGIFFLTHFTDEIVYLINKDVSTTLFLYKKIIKKT